MTVNKNFKSDYYIGLNDKDLKVQKYTTETMLKIIVGCLRHHAVENFSYSIINGCYKGGLETTIKLELFDDRLTSDCIIELEKVLNQECIAEVITQCVINFI